MAVAFSGIQPTGDIHLGNYLGALRNWVKLQDSYDAVYCIVDLHALTSPYDPATFSEERLKAAKAVIAAGVDPERSLLYYQSDVPAHAELAWLLGTLTSLGSLNRMTQFKDKSDQSGSNLGLYAYPVLMAADILVYRANVVPVGEDQTQHLELARDLAERFNQRFGEVFPLPEAIIPERGARVMSLRDPTSKMSKSDPSEASRVLMLDDPDTIIKKIGRAVTDSGTDIRYDWEGKAGISNLLEMLSLFTDTSVEELEIQHADTQYGAFKRTVAEAVVEGLRPVRDRYTALADADVVDLMSSNAARGIERAKPFQNQVFRSMGLIDH